MYEAELPQAEALWLAGIEGPLATGKLPGVITATPAGVTLDGRALLSLAHLGCLGVDRGAVVYEGDIPVLVFGEGSADRHEVREVVPAVPGTAGHTFGCER